MDAVAPNEEVVTGPSPRTQTEGDAALAVEPPPDAFIDNAEENEGLEPSLSRRSGKKAQRREERAKRKDENRRAHIGEFRALLDVLMSLPAAVPAFVPIDSLCHKIGGKGDGKRAHYDASPEEIEATLSAAEGVLASEKPYRSLPEAFGPQHGLEVLGSLIDRPPKYQEKMLGQELSLIAKLWAIAVSSTSGATEGKPALTSDIAIIDIGAGNGCLAFLAALILGGHAVLIDHTLPPATLRVEEKLPEQYAGRIIRITADIASLDASINLEPVLMKHGIRRAIVIAKHLCGLGTDLAEGFILRWRAQQQSLSDSCKSDAAEARLARGHASIELLGAVMATCCGHKIGKADREAFAKLHVGDPYLHTITSGETSR
jgi:hypothetical protein